MATGIGFIVLVICIAFLFDFINGFHDAGNAIATIVTTGVLSPKQAVLWAAFFNFIAFLVFKLMVAKTMGIGLINADVIDSGLLLAALIGAICWNLLTWYFGLPSSSSHALIGGLAGAAMTKAGFSALIPAGFLKVFIGILIAPLLGLAMGFLLCLLFKWIAKNQQEKKQSKHFKRLQLASSALLSLTHGGNDAQKTMGIIASVLFTESLLGAVFYVPFWVVLSCNLVISLGTLLGGWRIVHTMGKRITDLNPLRGCAAETGAAAMIFIATEYGVPVSTTHTVTGAITGTGLVNTAGLSGPKWKLLRLIFLSWVITIPVTGLIAAGVMILLA